MNTKPSVKHKKLISLLTQMLDIRPAQTPLERKIFNRHYDNFLTTGQFNPDLLPYLDEKQMYAVNELKKALIRLNNKK